jgi:hypothetical protein
MREGEGLALDGALDELEEIAAELGNVDFHKGLTSYCT